MIVHVRHLINPYPHTFPDDTFHEMLVDIVEDRAADIEKRHADGEYGRLSMGFVIMDPTAAISTPSLRAVMALASVGPEGDDFIPNALAKAVVTRDRGVECGAQVYSLPHMLADGDFRYGFAASVDFTLGGGSGLTEIQDRYQTTLLLADYNLRVATARKAWSEEQGQGRWYCNQNEPGDQYTAFLKSIEI